MTSTATTQSIDEAKLGQLMGSMVGYMTGGAMCFGIWLGDELGLYRALAGPSALTADEVAAKAGCNPRLVREWLDGQVAGGLDRIRRRRPTATSCRPRRRWRSPTTSRRRSSPAAMNAFGSMFMDIDKIRDAFRGDGALSWGDHHPCLFSGTEWFFRTGYRAELPSWIAGARRRRRQAAAGGTRRRRRLRSRRLGRGAWREAYPKAKFSGSTSTPRRSRRRAKRAAEAGVVERTTFEVADAKGYERQLRPHLLLRLPARHGRPGRHRPLRPRAPRRRRHRAPRRAVRAREPTQNIDENPMAPLLYTASSAICTPNSLSQEVGLGLGAQAGEARLRDGLRAGRVHALPAGGRDAAEPHPRSEGLSGGVGHAGIRWRGTAAGPVRSRSDVRGVRVERERPRRLRRRDHLVPVAVRAADRARLPEPRHRPHDGRARGARRGAASPASPSTPGSSCRLHARVRRARVPDDVVGEGRVFRNQETLRAMSGALVLADGALPGRLAVADDASPVPGVPLPSPPRAVRSVRRAGGRRRLRAGLDAVHRARARRRPGRGHAQGETARGASLLIAYSLGLGLPFLLVGLGVGRFARRSTG